MLEGEDCSSQFIVVFLKNGGFLVLHLNQAEYMAVTITHSMHLAGECKVVIICTDADTFTGFLDLLCCRLC